MQEWKTIEEALDYAIASEIEAAKFYTDLAASAKDPAMSKVFEGFAREENGHRAKLEKIKAGGAMKASEKMVLDLKIADYLVDVEADGDLDYQSALILAMKREKAAFKLYSDLARTTLDDGLRDVFRGLAQEEAKHKLRFEIEYDDEVLRDN